MGAKIFLPAITLAWGILLVSTFPIEKRKAAAY